MKIFTPYLKTIAVSTALLFLLFTECKSVSHNTEQTVDTTVVVDTHLGELMGHMQYDFLKLGLALQHRNQPLATFYMHEVDEAYSDIAGKNIINDSLDISALIKENLYPAKQELAGIISRDDTAHFTEGYHNMINSCNSCHRETHHEFIVIEEPHEEYNGQRFAKQ